MKKVVKLISIIAAVLMLGAAFVSCSGGDIYNEIKNAVVYPEEYSITYEIEQGGIIRTLTKAVDGEGNVYFASGDKEELYINDSGKYTLYVKGEGGFAPAEAKESYKIDYVNEKTSEFVEYAEKSMDAFLPTAKLVGDDEVLGRTCDMVEIVVGIGNTGVKYKYSIDDTTGICLEYEVVMGALGFELPTSDEKFTCTEFKTENIESLKNLIK